MEPLVSKRVSPSLSHVGVDFAGPLFVRRSPTSRKAHICIFICTSSCMTHFELTSDLSTNEVLIRMTSRIGLCTTIWPYNAATFKRPDREIKQLFTQESSANKPAIMGHNRPERTPGQLNSKGIKGIVEHSPWSGGWWERLAHSMK